MKYIKTFENTDEDINIKKYLVTVFYNKVIKIFENIDEDENFVKLKVLYSWEAINDPLLTKNLSLPPYKEFIVKKNQKYIDYWFNDVKYQTDSIKDALEMSKILSNSLKYNL